MLTPMPAGTPVDDDRFQSWIDKFHAYIDPITRATLDSWLAQFKNGDHDAVARFLDAVEIFSRQEVRDTYKSILDKLPGWDASEDKRQGKWRFVAFSSSSGESGDQMIHNFRQANGLSANRFKKLFIYKSELMNAELGPDDTVVVIDDFTGSGKQAVDCWPMFQELLFDSPNVYLVLHAANQKALTRIDKETEMQVRVGRTLNDREDFFSNACTKFSVGEKNKLFKYCKIAKPKDPKGIGECGLVCVFFHGCPNNSLPVLHANTTKWVGLFPKDV